MRQRTRKRRVSSPLMLLWTKRDQLRFIDGVERFQAAVNDLVVIVEEAKRAIPRRRKIAAATNGSDKEVSQ